MEEVEVVVAHRERATLRVGHIFLKIDPDPARADVEIQAMTLAPVPTPTIRWHHPPVLALAEVPGKALGRLEEPSPASPDAWAAAGAAIRRLHEAPLPPWPGKEIDALAARLERECAWLAANDVLAPAVLDANRRRAEGALASCTPAFIHGDLQIAHVFTDDAEVTGIIDWSEAGPGDPVFDLATLTLAHEERLGDLLDGYGIDVDRERIAAWWSWRCLVVARWLTENGFGELAELPELAVLESLA